MRRRRPPRAWIGAKVSRDPTELVGPKGLTAEVLRGDDDDSGDAAQDSDTPLNSDVPLYKGSAAPPKADPISKVRHSVRDWHFYWSLLSPERQARILAVIEARLKSVTVVLDRLLDPHNTAAILRTSEGLGISRAHVVSHEEEDALAHRRVTQDAHKWIDVELHGTGAAAAHALEARGYEVWAGHLDEKALLYTALPADRPLALLFGNEHEGPSRETIEACTGSFRIPMAGFTQSFNVSVAAGMALAQSARARRAFLQAAGDLSPPERVLLQERFTLLAAKLARRVKPGA